MEQEITETQDVASPTIANLEEDAPGIKGEIMFVNADSFEECSQNLDTIQLEGANVSDEDELLINSDVKTCVNKSGLVEVEPELVKRELHDTLPKQDQSESPDDDEDFLNNTEWLNKEKHIFILSESGKPIYSRHGKEDRLVTLYGLMQALVSFVADGEDTIRCITAADHKFVFLVRSPLILVAVSHSSASIPQLFVQLTYVHSQIVCVLTGSALTRMFEKRRNYDFRNLIGGTERLLDNLITSLDHDPSYLLCAIECLPLHSSVKDAITQTIIHYCSKIKNLVFGLIITPTHLVSLVRMKNFLLHPADLHLLFNLVSSTESLKSSENWMPICLPKFDSKGYLYGHVSYLADDCQACLLLLTVDKEQFYVLSAAKQKIVDKLRRQHCLEKINQSMRCSSYISGSVGCPDVRHFLYKSKSTSQFTCPRYTAPYDVVEAQQKLFGMYQLLHHRIHSVSRPLKMVYAVAATETLIGWVTKEFELYATLEPLVTKANAIVSVNKILQWIKNEENKLFILNSPTF